MEAQSTTGKKIPIVVLSVKLRYCVAEDDHSVAAVRN